MNDWEGLKQGDRILILECHSSCRIANRSHRVQLEAVGQATRLANMVAKLEVMWL